MRILMLGDVVGRPGRETVAKLLPELRDEYTPDLVIANGENAAGGLGITKDAAQTLLKAGVDVITLGNHTWTKKDIIPFIDEEPRLLRPANFPPMVPGRGSFVYKTAAGVEIAVVNLVGRTFMVPVDDPFRVADELVGRLRAITPIIFVDMHAEATSEKSAMAWRLDGKVTAVLGTHTHIQTADERIFPKGTAYITDIGMVGPTDSILGMRPELVINKFITQMPQKFEVAGGPTVAMAVIVDFEANGRATSIARLCIRATD
ncbi:MAG: TIGR00282 family metallophosphoesterase [Armatimonadota bacterium]|nr:TIGR00282 family metallophosphoesterase [Armatimonadota bacterium]